MKKGGIKTERRNREKEERKNRRGGKKERKIEIEKLDREEEGAEQWKVSRREEKRNRNKSEKRINVFSQRGKGYVMKRGNRK